jgi:hypothetical protein
MVEPFHQLTFLMASSASDNGSQSSSVQPIKIPIYVLIVIVVLIMICCTCFYCMCCKPTKNKRKIAAMLKEARLENDA